MVKLLDEAINAPLLAGNTVHDEKDRKKIIRFLSPRKSSDSQSTTFILSPYRWINLILFSLVTMTNACLWITLTSITDVIESYYKLKAIYVDWLSLAFFIICGVLSLPGVYVLSNFGLRICILLAAFLNAFGASTRMLGLEPAWYFFVAIGQCITACGSIFALAVPPKLAAVWFSENERATATSVATLMNVFGVCVGFLQSSLMTKDVSSCRQIRFELFRLMISQSLFCWLLFLSAVILVRDEPPFPPSLSELERREGPGINFNMESTSLRSALKNVSYVLVCVAYSLNFACEVSLSILLNQLLKEGYWSTQVTNVMVGWLGFTATLCGLPASFVIGLALDQVKHYRIAATLLLFFSFLALTSFGFLLLRSHSFYLLSFSFCLFNVFSCPYFCFGLDHVAELSHPVAEDIASGVPLVLGNAFSFIMTYGFQLLLDIGRTDLVLCGFCGAVGLGASLTMISTSELKRSRIKMNFEETDCLLKE